jgi:hypothetical protein
VLSASTDATGRGLDKPSLARRNLGRRVGGQYCNPAQSKELIARLRGSKSVRNRAMAILAHLRRQRPYDRPSLGYVAPHYSARRRIYEPGGVRELFTRTARPGLKINDESLKAFNIRASYEPPGNHGINRTTWTMAHLSAVLAEQGHLHARLLSGRSPRPQDTNGAKRGLCSPRTIPTTPKNSPTSV